MASMLRTIITMGLRDYRGEDTPNTPGHLLLIISDFHISAKPEGNKVQLLSLLFSYLFHPQTALPCPALLMRLTVLQASPAVRAARSSSRRRTW